MAWEFHKMTLKPPNGIRKQRNRELPRLSSIWALCSLRDEALKGMTLKGRNGFGKLPTKEILKLRIT